MGFQIEDGSGTGRRVRVTADNQIESRSESLPLEHYISYIKGQAYQVISVDTGITAKTQTLLHIRNDDASLLLVVSSVRIQAITNTASKPVVGEYFQLGFGRTVSSGGTTATPVNVNQASGNTASVTVTGIDPTMAGTFTEIDRIYHQASGDEYLFEKGGAIILGQNDTFEVRFVAAGTGEAKCEVSFLMIEAT